MNSGDVHVCTLQVRGAGAQTPALRLRLGHLLNTADLRPAGLPPAAVLVVRRLTDPLPGRLVNGRAAHRVNSAWEKAVCRSLSDLCRRAVRPRRGVIYGEPEAVLFADEAETLACMLQAQQRGLSASAWWWRVLGARPDPVSTVIGRLLKKPYLAPAVFGNLNAWGKAGDVLVKWPHKQATALLHAVIERYQLPGLLPTNQSGPLTAVPPSDPQTTLPQTPANQSRARGTQLPVGEVVPSWSGMIAAPVPPELGPEQQALLGLCLVLQSRPVAVQTPAFQRQWRQWWRKVLDSPPVSVGLAEESSSTVARRSWSDLRAGAIRSETDEASEVSAASGSQVASDPAGQAEIAQLASQVIAATPAPTKRDLVDAAHRHEVDSQLPVAETAALVGQAAVTLEPDALSWSTTGVETDIGGVLYLLNLMRALDLPASCEPGWSLASRAGAWGALELLGRALLGPIGVSHAADLLWRVLAELDGRPPETLPGVDYEIAGDGSLPVGWTATGDMWSPDDSPLLLGVNEDLQRWLRLVVPVIRHRLQKALRLADIEDAPGVMLLTPGRMFITGTHVDLVLSLDAISTPVRRAGLDADPGWLSAFGRIVRFHFR